MREIITCSCCNNVLKETKDFSPWISLGYLLLGIAGAVVVTKGILDDGISFSEPVPGGKKSIKETPAKEKPDIKDPAEKALELAAILKAILHSHGEWKPEYDSYKYLCSSCFAKLAIYKCKNCENSISLIEDTPRVAEITKKFPSINIAKYANICSFCIEILADLCCDKCKSNTHIFSNHIKHYFQDADIRDALSPNHPDWNPDWTILCKQCYIDCHHSAESFSENGPVWIRALLGNYSHAHSLADLNTQIQFSSVKLSYTESIDGYRIVKSIKTVGELFKKGCDLPTFSFLNPNDFLNIPKYVKQVGGNAIINFLVYYKNSDENIDRSEDPNDLFSKAGFRVTGDVVFVEKANDSEKPLPTSSHAVTQSPRTKFIVDGLNILRYVSRDNLDIRILLAIATALLQRNYSFECFFDAVTPFVLAKMDAKKSNAPGYEASADLLSRLISRMPDMFMIVPGGIQADDFIVHRADNTGASIVSNDRYRDAKFTKYQWIINSNRLIKGMVINNDVSIPVLEMQFPLAKNLSEQFVAFEKEVERVKSAPEKLVVSLA